MGMAITTEEKIQVAKCMYCIDEQIERRRLYGHEGLEASTKAKMRAKLIQRSHLEEEDLSDGGGVKDGGEGVGKGGKKLEEKGSRARGEEWVVDGVKEEAGGRETVHGVGRRGWRGW
ncbi:hypothetical protein ACH5RR_040918 [Cinchona calisaya]|uniref:Uncharacterized protein n=1 Tax=Cinchona calisaya TaxID=153742 RepID=A0ABD2XSL9_9GENT